MDYHPIIQLYTDGTLLDENNQSFLDRVLPILNVIPLTSLDIQADEMSIEENVVLTSENLEKIFKEKSNWDHLSIFSMLFISSIFFLEWNLYHYNISSIYFISNGTSSNLLSNNSLSWNQRIKNWSHWHIKTNDWLGRFSLELFNPSSIEQNLFDTQMIYFSPHICLFNKIVDLCLKTILLCIEVVIIVAVTRSWVIIYGTSFIPIQRFVY